MSKKPPADRSWTWAASQEAEMVSPGAMSWNADSSRLVVATWRRMPSKGILDAE